MEKVMIIGSGGSGKSTFARSLGEVTGLPVYHLDAIFWKPNWEPTPRDEMDELQTKLVREDKWIIDGNYGRTLEIRLQEADTVIFFDLPRYITIYRIFKRRIQYHGKTRPDLNEGCPEQLDWQFVKWVWNFRRDKRPGIMEKLKAYSETKNIVVFRTSQGVNQFLKQLKSNRQTV